MLRVAKLITFLVAIAPTLIWAQGFPLLSKKSVVIQRMLPPTVNLNKKRIKIEARVEASVKGGDTLPALLKTKLVTMIQKDPRFIVEEVQPETILKFAVTNYYTEKWTVGTGQDQHQEYRGKLEVAYQAVETKTGATLDSENLLKSIGYEDAKSSESSIFGPARTFIGKKQETGKGSENLVRDDLIDGIVFEMGKRVAPVEEPEEVLLPGGKLEPLSALATNRRWGTLEEQAEKMDKLPKPPDDTYRLYLLALAKEAEAYDLAREANERELGKRPDISKDEAGSQFKHAQADMDEARKIYQQIVEANPKEKNFRPGDARTELAMNTYATIVRYQDELKKAEAAVSSNTQSAPGDRSPGPATRVTSPLDRVLDFCRKGVDPSGILDYVNSPDFGDDAKVANYKFNFGTDMLALTDACKKGAPLIQKAMRQRLDPSAQVAAATPATPAATPAAAPATTTKPAGPTRVPVQKKQ